MKELHIRELLFISSIFLDGEGSVPFIDVENAVLQKDIAAFIRAKLPELAKKTSFSMENVDASELNEALYDVMIGEYNSAQPGTSGKKWGIRNNGICFLVALCGEVLTGDL